MTPGGIPTPHTDRARNGSVSELKHSFLAAAQEGRRAWRAAGRLAAPAHPVWTASEDERLTHRACNVGSERLWALGGWAYRGRSTAEQLKGRVQSP